MEYKGYTISMEQVEVTIQADSHDEAVAKLRAGDFTAELLVESYGGYGTDDTWASPAKGGIENIGMENYGVDTLRCDETDVELDVETMEVA
tara:strand:- start:49 stop:321 length:273 start_codon:yes stop_codon:yes gene_type:complete